MALIVSNLLSKNYLHKFSNIFLSSISVPDDYVTSTQEEKELIEVLCMKEGAPQITLSDSDSDVVPPSQPEQHVTPRSRLKLSKPTGELLVYVAQEVE